MAAVLLGIWFMHVAALMSPGANVLLVSQLAASDRGRSAFFAALGVTAGALVWASSAVLGVHALFTALPTLRLVLQIAGAAYLLYLAVKLWRSNGGALDAANRSTTALQAFRMGLLTNVTNPKSALFFASIFAASFPADPPFSLQVAAVGMIVANAFCWHVLLAWGFSRPQVRAAYSRQRRKADRVASVVVGALGLRLLSLTLRP
ncbi:MAG: LysE family transporter [Pseudomonadota bacterium]